MFTVLALAFQIPGVRRRPLVPAVKSAREGLSPRGWPRAARGEHRRGLGPTRAGGTPGPRSLVGGGSRAQGVLGELGTGRVDAGKILDVTVAVHLQGHDGLLHGLLVTAGGGQEVVCTERAHRTGGFRRESRITTNTTVLLTQARAQSHSLIQAHCEVYRCVTASTL